MQTEGEPKLKPTIALVGAPNVGKSTLFNRLTQTRDALVADQPGMTRDLKAGEGQIGEASYIVVDTGGIAGDPDIEDALTAQVAQRALEFARESDATVLMVDGRSGLNAHDEILVAKLRESGANLYLAVNKTEGCAVHEVLPDYVHLGFHHIYPVSALHGDGVKDLIETITAEWPPSAHYHFRPESGIRFSVVGRPNVGKSTLVNRFLGYEKMIASDVPGTTRDSVDARFEVRGEAFTVVDTAGLRRKSKVHETAEKFSAIQTLKAIDRAEVVVVLLDAQAGILDQDQTVLSAVIAAGRGLVVAVNKWDGLSAGDRRDIKSEFDRKLSFADFAECHYISALHGSGVGDLIHAIKRAWSSANISPKTNELTALLERFTQEHPPPLVQGRRIKLRLGHLGGRNPPTIVIHGNQVEKIPESYKRYLRNRVIEELRLIGTPVRLEFRQGTNPYADRKNTLNKRQLAKRKRLLKHVKKRR
ncbi:MAG: ribosome biogenesis GTPase Der [Pseudomonadota bacterium]